MKARIASSHSLVWTLVAVAVLAAAFFVMFSRPAAETLPPAESASPPLTETQ